MPYLCLLEHVLHAAILALKIVSDVIFFYPPYDVQAAYQDQMGMPATISKPDLVPLPSRSAADWAQLIQQLPGDASALAASATQTVQTSSDWQVRLWEALKILQPPVGKAASATCGYYSLGPEISPGVCSTRWQPQTNACMCRMHSLDHWESTNTRTGYEDALFRGASCCAAAIPQ